MQQRYMYLIIYLVNIACYQILNIGHSVSSTANMMKVDHSSVKEVTFNFQLFNLFS